MNLRILHVGAHAGQEMELYAENGLEDVYWVEPQPKAVHELRKKVENKRVIPYAVWSRPKSMKMQISENEISSSFFEFASTNPFLDQKMVNEVEVECITLDRIIKDFLPRDNKKLILVLDIQGSELEALNGLNLKLTKNLVGVVVEVSETSIYKGAAQAKEVRRHLRAQGFSRCLSLVRRPTNHGDELFLRNSNLWNFGRLVRTICLRLTTAISLMRFLYIQRGNQSGSPRN
jgi:FkbM family methyltransferase